MAGGRAGRAGRDPSGRAEGEAGGAGGSDGRAGREGGGAGGSDGGSDGRAGREGGGAGGSDGGSDGRAGREGGGAGGSRRWAQTVAPVVSAVAPVAQTVARRRRRPSAVVAAGSDRRVAREPGGAGGSDRRVGRERGGAGGPHRRAGRERGGAGGGAGAKRALLRHAGDHPGGRTGTRRGPTGDKVDNSVSQVLAPVTPVGVPIASTTLAPATAGTLTEGGVGTIVTPVPLGTLASGIATFNATAPGRARWLPEQAAPTRSRWRGLRDEGPMAQTAAPIAYHPTPANAGQTELWGSGTRLYSKLVAVAQRQLPGFTWTSGTQRARLILRLTVPRHRFQQEPGLETVATVPPVVAPAGSPVQRRSIRRRSWTRPA